MTGADSGSDTGTQRPLEMLGASVLLIGHRGALGVEPENTMRSFRRARADLLRRSGGRAPPK